MEGFYEKRAFNFDCLLKFFLLFTRKAETTTKNDLNFRDDLIFVLLTPLIDKEIDKHYGKVKQYYCAKILKIKKLQQGSYLFDVTVQVRTFEGAHNPPYDLVSITLSNRNPLEWRVMNYNSKRLKPNELTKCRHPL
ncbi:DUF3888 domain-containing protein [Neobacillus sp. YIM B06451]|uniref:DUF3888 domain-containing protein n=1 Tax=Neobacillus sp. YIM B06451 TaxID=3070994 RepID=UPI0029313A34|nr:DUF3888 domain-containing protein [Neobacillus sp. YIM B06451]